MRRRAAAGITLMDALLGALVIVLLVVVLWPNVRVRAVLRVEESVRRHLDDVRKLLEAHRDAASTDADGDREGEFPGLGAVLTADDVFRPVERTDAWEADGYYYAVRLPDRLGRPVPARSRQVSADGAEVSCLLVAWPSEPGETGMRAFCWRPADGFLKHAVDGYPYGGADSPPLPPGSLFRNVDGQLRPAKYDGKYWVHPR